MTTAEAATLELRRCLGAGGFGEVYLADRLASGGLRSEVAVKVLREGLDPRSQAVQRLVDEARLLAWLNHPNLLRVHELVSLDGRVALVAEYVDGADLDACCTGDDPIGPGATCEALARVADALHAAWHRPGPSGEPLHLLHRDIKPANIRIGRHGEVKLLDFGIAKAAGLERSASTRADALIGSFPYLAPERFDRDAQDGPPADVFSLGCTLYEAVAHRPLLDLGSKELFHLAMDEPSHRLRIRSALEGIEPAPLREMLAALLAYGADERPAMADLGPRLEDLAEALGGTRLTRWCRDHAWPAAPEQDGVLIGRSLTVASLGDTASPPTAAFPSAELEVATPPPAVAVRSGRSWWLPALGLVGMAGVGLVALGGLGLAGTWWALRDPAVGPAETIEKSPEPSVVPTPPPVSEPAPEPVTTPPPTRPTVPSTAPATNPEPTAGAPSCGDPSALEAPALLGQLPADTRACLAAAMRDTTRKQTERDTLGRVLLVDARARCSAGDCSAYEREQPVFFELVTRSDPDMMLAWSEHLFGAASSDPDAALWAERSLERKDAWRGAERVSHVSRAHEIVARVASARWAASPRDDALRLEARNSAAAWAEVLSDFARDPAPAMALCLAAAGTSDPCTSRTAPAPRTELLFTSAPVGAVVSVDGEQVGTTPLKLPVDHGTHRIELRVDDRVGTQSITVDPASPTGWHWDAAADSWKPRQ
ncbi:MAG: serine/threonine protein kinase [Alphaproteobacteria bacterium]|nr:serine/threonine protein kinase [Alphaproteobacteria bacterium]